MGLPQAKQPPPELPQTFKAVAPVTTPAVANDVGSRLQEREDNALVSQSIPVAGISKPTPPTPPTFATDTELLKATRAALAARNENGGQKQQRQRQQQHEEESLPPIPSSIAATNSSRSS